MEKAEVVTLPSLNPGFPDQPDKVIERGNLINLIESQFDADADLVVVEGGEGYGKTTLLAQYVKTYPDSACSAFIVAGSKWSYDPDIIRYELANQLNWILQKKELDDERVTEGEMGRLYHKISHKWKYDEKHLRIVVDGLDNIPDVDEGLLSPIISLLPVGMGDFRVLVSGDGDQIKEQLRRTKTVKIVPVPAFSTGQTLEYLSNIGLDEEDALDLHKSLKGVPGYLATARSLLLAGEDPEDIISGSAAGMEELYASLWRRAGDLSRETENALGFRALFDRTFSTRELSNLLDSEKDELEDRLSALPFCKISDQSNVVFVTEGFRSFVAGELKSRKPELREVIINRLLENPDSEDAFRHLPTLLAEKGDYQELLEYLSTENLEEIVRSTGAVSPLYRQIQVGLQGAKELRREGDLLRLGLDRSVITELSGLDVRSAEVEARMALGREGSARLLVDQVRLKEDRLHLLSIIARMEKQEGREPDPDVTEEVKRLFNEIDLSVLGRRASTIAAELVHTNPGLALELVEEATGKGEGGSVDRALAMLSFSAAAIGPDSGEGVTEKIVDRIQSPRLRTITGEASLLFDEYSPVKAVERAKAADSIESALFILRLWLEVNSKRDGAIKVTEYALDRIVESRDYIAGADVFRELAAPLKHSANKDAIGSIISKIEAQRTVIRDRGPLVEYFRLICELARGEVVYDEDDAYLRLIDAYRETDSIDELSDRLEVLAEIHKSISRIVKAREGRDDLQVEAAVRADFYECLDRLANTVAFQFTSVERTIEVLSKDDLALANEIASSLYTQSRCDKALLKAVKSGLRVPDDSLDLLGIVNALDGIDGKLERDRAIDLVVRRIAAVPADDPVEEEVLSRLFEPTFEIWEPEQFCRAGCYWLIIATKHKGIVSSGFIKDFEERLKSRWLNVEPYRKRVEVGFRIAALLAEDRPELADSIFEQTVSLRGNRPLEGSGQSSTLISCLSLATRAYRGVVASNLEVEADRNKLEDLIGAVSDRRTRGKLWAEVALRAHFSGREDVAERIVGSQLRPLVEPELWAEDYYRWQLLVEVAPALYRSNPVATEDRLDGLPQPLRDDALGSIANAILRKSVPGEPYKSYADQAASIDYEEALTLANLGKAAETSGVKYPIIRKLTATGKHSDIFTYEQKNTLAEKIREIAADFPLEGDVPHEGYNIAGEAAALSLIRSDQKDWNELCDRAEKLPNASDRTYVLGAISEFMPDGRYGQANIFERAVEEAKSIGSVYDSVERLVSLSEVALQFDQSRSRGCIEEAISLTRGKELNDVKKLQRRAVDIAYRIDREFAKDLVDLLDQDPAREQPSDRERLAQLRSYVGRQVKVRKIRDEVSTGSAGVFGRMDQEELAESGRETLGSLNARRMVAFERPVLQDLIFELSRFDLSVAYYWYSSLVESAVLKYSGTDEAETILRPLFDSLCNVSGLCGALIRERTEKVGRGLSKRKVESDSFIVRGDREEALKALRKWLRENVEEVVVICDPYFGPKDVEALQLIQFEAPDAEIRVMTSAAHHKESVEGVWSDRYHEHWNRISDERPPSTEIVIVGKRPTGEPPIHDRWWFGDDAGIRTGTSFNALGKGKAAEVSPIEEDKLDAYRREVFRFVDDRIRDYEGGIIEYNIVVL